MKLDKLHKRALRERETRKKNKPIRSQKPRKKR